MRIEVRLRVSTACRKRAGIAEPNTRTLAAGGTDAALVSIRNPKSK
jgi:hypothetical protein